jgi:hypothetical protein
MTESIGELGTVDWLLFSFRAGKLSNESAPTNVAGLGERQGGARRFRNRHGKNTQCLKK